MSFSVSLQRLQRITSGNGLRAQLLRGGIGSLSVKVANALLAFAVAVVLARLLGPEGYGVYSFALAIIMLTAVPGQVGVPQLVVRETAKAHRSGNYRLMRGLWRWSNLAVGGFSCLALALVAGVIWFTDIGGEGARIVTLAVGVPLIPIIALANVRSASLRGLRRVVQGQLPESIIRPAFLLFLVLVWGIWLAEDKFTPQMAMGFYVIAASFAFVAGAWLLHRKRPVEMKEHPVPEYQSSAWRNAVIPLAMITGLQLINKHADVIILGIFGTDEEVGVYRAVTQVSMLIIFGFQALNQVFQPYYARAYKDDKQSLQRLVTISSRLILVTAFFPALAIFIYSGELLRLAFGSAYEVGAFSLIILASGQFINASMGSLGPLLNMTGHERVTFFWVAWAAAVNVVLTVILVPFFGMEGAAAASTISLVLYNLVLWRAVRLRLAVDTLPIRMNSSWLRRDSYESN